MASSSGGADGVYFANLREFQYALRSAEGASARELTTALKAGGEPILSKSKSLAPRRSGLLASGYKTQVRGTTGSIVSAVPYAGGADWGQRGKWSGFAKYGPAGGRIATRAIDSEAETVMQIITRALEDILEIHGWAA